MNRSTFVTLTSAIGILCCVPTAIHALVIDDFEVGALVKLDDLSSGGVSELQLGLDPAHTAATARYIAFNASDPFPFGDTGAVTVQVDTADGGALRYLPDPGLTAANFIVNYGQTRFGLPPMSLDLLADGATQLSFEFGSTRREDQLPFSMDIRLSSGSGTSFGTFLPLPVSPDTSRLNIPFSQILSQSPNFDLSRVTIIQFGSANGTISGPFVLNKIETIPEPSTVSCLVIGLLATITRRCSRRT